MKKLVESKDEDEKKVYREEYKLARKEAKFVVSAAKIETFESLYDVLEERYKEKRLFRLSNARKQKGRNLYKVKCIKREDGKVLVEDIHIKRRWKLYFYRLLNNEEDKDMVLGKLKQFEGCRDFGYCRHIKVEEAKEAICRIRKGKEIGPNKIWVDF